MINPTHDCLRRLVASVAQLEREGTPATYDQVQIDTPEVGRSYVRYALVVAMRQKLLTNDRRGGGYRVTDLGRAVLRGGSQASGAASLAVPSGHHNIPVEVSSSSDTGGAALEVGP